MSGGSSARASISVPAGNVTKQAVERPRGRAAQWRSSLAMDGPALWFLLGAAVFVYFEVFILPSVPIAIVNDQSINLDNAVRMVHGQAIYKDFFQYTLPGCELLYYILFEAFGIRAWIPNAALIALAVASAWLGLMLSRRVLKGWHAYVPVLFFLYAFHFALDATHHKYSVLLVLAATAALIDSRTLVRVALGGLLLGLAACFTQSRGAMAAAAFAAFLVWEGWSRKAGVGAIAERVGALVGAFAAVVVAVSAYFVGEIGIRKFIACTVVFPMNYYRADTAYNTWSGLVSGVGPFAHWYDAPRVVFAGALYVLIPAVYAVAMLVLWRRARIGSDTGTRERLAVLVTAGLALWASIIYAPEFVRLCEASLPAFIVAFWLLEWVRRRDAWFAGAAIGVGLAMAGTMARTQTRWRGILETPLGRSAVLERQTYARYSWVAHHTRPWEFFFEAIYSDMYFGVGLRNPAEVPYVTANGYTRPEQVRALVEALEAKPVKFVLWSAQLDARNPQRPDDYLGPLRSYLQVNFAPVKDLGDGYVVLERRSPRKDESG